MEPIRTDCVMTVPPPATGPNREQGGPPWGRRLSEGAVCGVFGVLR